MLYRKCVNLKNGVKAKSVTLLERKRGRWSIKSELKPNVEALNNFFKRRASYHLKAKFLPKKFPSKIEIQTISLSDKLTAWAMAKQGNVN